MADMKYVLGIDLGTSGTKTVLFDQEGKGICSATVEYPMYQPQNGWAEQDPHDWANAAVSTIKTVLTKSGVNNEDVVSLGISGQMHGLVMLDEAGEVIRPSIIWCDQRTAKECEEITEKVGYENLIRITANPALPGFTLGKLMWVRNHEPKNYAKCKHVLLPKDYVLVSESGISNPQTVRELREAGFRGFLIGETFMKTPDPGAALKAFIEEVTRCS